MRLPTVRGVIERRILVNYRIDPVALERLLPPPFRPRLIRGCGLAGICLIRLRGVQPRFLPACLGLCSENAAHRIAVEWDEDGSPREGVYIPRRDTDSRLVCWAGGRAFPGYHHRARFRVRESSGRYRVSMRSNDGRTRLEIHAHCAARLASSSVFPSLGAASEFVRAGSMGYSATPDLCRFQGLELRCATWQIEPLAVEYVRTGFFENGAIFPPGSVEFDSALLMRNVEHEWHALPDLVCRSLGHTPESATGPISFKRPVLSRR